jgi:hypothetical protein
MKTRTKFTLLALFVGFVVFSCNKEFQNQTPTISSLEDEFNQSTSVSHPKIVYATWDGWGRISQECDGWDLCNFDICALCCVDDLGNIIDCENETEKLRAAEIITDSSTGIGVMVIKLKTSDTEQNNAINNTLTLSIDADIISDGYRIQAGQYGFDPNIGDHGGYELPVTEL